MFEEVDAFLGRVMTEIASTLAAAGTDEVAQIKTDLDIPIGYAGIHTIRSSPNEPPRRGQRTHPLQDSIKSAVQNAGNVVSLTVAAGPAIDANTGEEYAAKLEVGFWSNLYKSEQYPRPYMGPSMERIKVGAEFTLVGKLIEFQ